MHLRFRILAPLLGALLLTACTGGAAGDPEDDIGDIIVLTHSPGNGQQLDADAATDGFNALNNPTLVNPGAVTLVFTNSLDPTSVINAEPGDPQGTRNVRLFHFDTDQGPFDPNQPRVPGVNPPGANVLVGATTVLTSTNMANDTLIMRPTGVSSSNPLPEGQYSVIVELGVRGADGDGMKGREFFFFFRVGQDNLGPVVVTSVPAPGERDVDPTSEIRITMSETILASTINVTTLSVTYQPAGALTPVPIPGEWFADGGNGPGNNLANRQLDFNGRPGFTGSSPRNGVDLVFRPNLIAFPVNMIANPCGANPPTKGNRGFPLGQVVQVQFAVGGSGIQDTASNSIPTGSPNTTFTFETRSGSDPVFAPHTDSAIYYGDTIGIGVIDVDPTRTPYVGGPNPARLPDSVVTRGTGPAPQVVRVPIPDLVGMAVDSRPYSAFYNFGCTIPPTGPTIARGRMMMGLVFAASASLGGGEIVVVDTYDMDALGRFGTPSPGDVAITAVGLNARLVVSNFSANTVSVFDVGNVMWAGPTFFGSQNSLSTAVANGQATLLLTEADFANAFPVQRPTLASPPGPPLMGTINVGIGPATVKVTGLPGSIGTAAPALSSNIIVAALNTGENTIDFAELTNLSQSAAIQPDLDGVNLSSTPSDAAWSPFSFNTGAYHFYIAGVGGTVELFSSGFLANRPTVRPEGSRNTAPNQIISSIGGLKQPTAVQWIPSGNAVSSNNAYSQAVLITEAGENRIQQLSITAEFPSILFQSVNSNLPAGLGPVGIAGDPASVRPFPRPIAPRFTTYYVANAGEGSVTTGSYIGGVIGTSIPVPGVLMIASWWNR